MSKRARSKKNLPVGAAAVAEPASDNESENLAPAPVVPAEPSAPKIDTASKAQVYATQLYAERKQRLGYMNRAAEMERENAKLRGELADARREIASLLSVHFEQKNTEMFKDVDLHEGDQVTDRLQGHEGTFMIVRN